MAKEKMIRGDTFWDETKDAVRGVPFRKAQHDIVIVGGGMSGSFAAYVFTKAGYRVCLLEKGRLGEQSSAANTGILQYSSDLPLFMAIKRFGKEDGRLFYEASFKGLEEIKSICRGFSEEVHCIERTSLYYASKRGDQNYIKKEYEALQDAGYPVEYLAPQEMKSRFGVDRYNGLLAHQDAEINPYAFVQEMLKEAVREGLVIHEGCGYRKHTENKGVQIVTDQGTLQADALILATGYAKTEADRYLKGMVERVRSYALVTEPVPEAWFWPEDVMLWESARPYLYLRRAQENRIVIGGLDEETDRLPSVRRIKKRGKELLHELKQLFPQIDVKAERVYGALFGETNDGMPIMGRLPGQTECYGLFGYGGNGTVYSSVGAQLLLDLIRGEKNPYEHLFRFERKKRRK